MMLKSTIGTLASIGALYTSACAATQTNASPPTTSDNVQREDITQIVHEDSASSVFERKGPALTRDEAATAMKKLADMAMARNDFPRHKVRYDEIDNRFVVSVTSETDIAKLTGSAPDWFEIYGPASFVVTTLDEIISYQVPGIGEYPGIGTETD